MEERVCICNTPYDIRRFMIECDFCEMWYHGSCVQITEEKALKILQYACPNCTKAGHQTKFATTQNSVSDMNLRLPLPYKFENLNLKDLASVVVGQDQNICRNKATADFRNILDYGMFARSGIQRIKSIDCSVDALKLKGFSEPILVQESIHLNMRLPMTTITLVDLEKAIGPNEKVKVLKVSTQKMTTMTREMFTSKRRMIDEPISMIFRLTGTQFEGRVQEPQVIKDVDWNYLLPLDQYEVSGVGSHLKMNPNLFGAYYGQYTYQDFTVQPGGAATWLCLLNGKCDVFLIPPSAENYSKLEQWMHESTKDVIFFGDVVEKCIKCEINAGATLIIPSGWIYSLISCQNSILFFGIFQHSLNFSLLLNSFQLDQRIGNKNEHWEFLPNPQHRIWFAGLFHTETLETAWATNTSSKTLGISQFEHSGLLQLIRMLKTWLNNSNQTGAQIPATIMHPNDLLDRLESVLSKTNILKHPTVGTTDIGDSASVMVKEELPTVCRCHSKKCLTCRNCIRRHCKCVVFSRPAAAAAGESPNNVFGELETEGPTVVTPSPSPPQENENETMLPDLESWSKEELNVPFISNSIWSESLSTSSSRPNESYDTLGLEVGELVFADAFDVPMPPGADMHDILRDDSDNSGEQASPSDLFAKGAVFDITEDDGEYSRHRASCHRCGNLRKKNVRCNTCPHIFCQKCAEKMINEHGIDAFRGGCPVCKELCCCGKNRSVNCSHKYHCYKKCPSTKRGTTTSPINSENPVRSKKTTKEPRIKKELSLSSTKFDAIGFPQFAMPIENQSFFPVSVAEIESNREEFASTSFSDIDVDLVDLENLP